MSRRRTSRLLLDTHIWYWYVAGSKDLSRPLREAIDEAIGTCWLSPISLWELETLAQKGRLTLAPGPVRWIRKALDAFPVQEAILNFEVALKVDELRSLHPDPGDRLLAATALVYDLTLVTVDRRLVAAQMIDTLTA